MNSNNRYGYLIRWLIGIGDLIVLNSVFFLVYKELGAIYVGAITHSMREVLLLLNFCYFLSLYFVPIQLHYSIVFIDKIVQRAVTLVTTHIFLFATCLIFLNVGDVLATFLLVYYLSTAVIFSLWRVFVRLLLKWYRRKGYNFKKVIIVGAGKNGMDLYHVMKDDLSYGFNILGFFDDNPALAASLPNLLGTTADVEEYALAHGVDEIYCTLPGTNDEKIARLLNFADKHMITVFPIMYIIIGILIKLSSPGPILFKQKRTGLYGHDFECYKFRTMKVNAEADTKQAIKDDPRKTKIGNFLRKTNLDEFPQFINVLKGDMSVVGPRPHMLKHTEQYSALIDKYMVRHLVKPGITGWAQVTGYRGETKTLEQMEGRVKRDVWYIENWTFFLDLKIIVVTLLNMSRGEKNAY